MEVLYIKRINGFAAVLEEDETVTNNLVVDFCFDNLNVQKGMEIYEFVFKFILEVDVFVGNTLLLFYSNYNGC